MSNSALSSAILHECASISPLSEDRLREAQAHIDSLTKPLGSLGRLEDMARQLYAIQEETPLRASPARMYTIAADHGVVAEGVASSPQELTVLMVNNFLKGGAGINCLCALAGADLRIVDAGVAGAPFPPHPALINARIAQGTANIAQGPAMTAEQCLKALELGIQLSELALQDGICVVGTGEMGIGNTTPSSALFSAYLGFSAAEMTGMGAGVPEKGLEHKTRVIEKALHANHGAVASGDPFSILAALGGLEIAAMSGLIIGGAARRMAVMIDGFIATAAYVAASRLAPEVEGYCFFCHGSAEAGHGKVLQRLNKKPLLDMGFRLGEGTGAAMGMWVLDAAAKMYNEMATFEGAGIKL